MADCIKEFHLFAGIGGGIYGGELLGHQCCGGVEIDDYCQKVLRQRQADGWMNEFPIYGDIRQLNGKIFKKQFDVLCGGFPCQAFSHAAHGNNISEKNLWDEMYRFAIESNAPVVFGENVTLKALSKAKEDLEKVGYTVEMCKLSCGELGADHRRDRFWLLAVKNKSVFKRIVNHLQTLSKFSAHCWELNPFTLKKLSPVTNRREQLKAVGNAQSPFVAACVFRILVNRHLSKSGKGPIASADEINEVFEKNTTWIKSKYGEDFGYVHTPTTMANYSAPSMMKHLGCRNFKTVFDKPSPYNAEYLMGFPIGASCLKELDSSAIKNWKDNAFEK